MFHQLWFRPTGVGMSSGWEFQYRFQPTPLPLWQQPAYRSEQRHRFSSLRTCASRRIFAPHTL
jgi:hypothetical protein